MIKAIIDSCLILQKKNLPESEIFLLKRRLTLIPKESGFGESAGPIYLYQETKDAFLIPRYAIDRFAKHLAIEYVDNTSDGHEINLKSKIVLREHQIGIMDKLEHYFKEIGTGGILQAGTGLGKSLCRGSKVIMFDGSIKNVEDVRVGDLLMGMDSTPRRVLALGSGYAKCYKITPTKGEPWRCNEDHILTLRCTSNRGVHTKTYERGRIIDIPLKEYLRKSKRFKRYYKQFRVGVEFQERDVFEPYMVGTWLGGGSKSLASICCGDGIVVDYWEEFCLSHGKKYRRWLDRGAHYLKILDCNGIYSIFSKCLVGGEKSICCDYKINSRKNRMLLLAGLLDADGYLCDDGVTYEICTKYEALKDDILFLSRSLGLAAYSSKRTKRIKSTGFCGEYYIITISGNTSEIPCLIERKKAKKRIQTKDVLNVGFKVEEDGCDEYFGFVLDGDHRYLIHDFTVTHNTIMAIELARRLGRTTLIKVYKDDLANQWESRILQSIPDAKIGRIQGDVCDYKGKDFVIAMIQSLVSRYEAFANDDNLRNYFGIEVVDECHRIGSREWSKTASIFNSKYRLGLTATPDRKDRCEDAFFLHIGPIIAKHDQTDLVPDIYFKETGYRPIKPEMDDWLPTTQIGILSKDYNRNVLIAGDIVKALNAGRKIIVLSKFVDHLHSLEKLVAYFLSRNNMNKKIGFYTGEVNMSEISKAEKIEELNNLCQKHHDEGDLESFFKIKKKIEGIKKGKIKLREKQSKDDLKEASEADVLFATFKKAEDALDIPSLDTLFYALPLSDPRQSCGRILRQHEGKKTPLVVDYVDSNLRFCFNLKNIRERYYVQKEFNLVQPKNKG